MKPGMRRGVAALAMLIAAGASIATSRPKWREKAKAGGFVALPAGTDRGGQTIAVEASHDGNVLFHLDPTWADPREPGAAVVIRLVPHSGGTPIAIPLTPATAGDAAGSRYQYFPTRRPREELDVIVERTGGKQGFELGWEVTAEIGDVGDRTPPGAFVRVTVVTAAKP